MAWLNKLHLRRLHFAILLLFSWVIAIGFILIQYNREKGIRAEMLNNQLQIINRQLLRQYPDVADIDTPFKDIRISIIRTDGKVEYDNATQTIPQSNHLSRPEVKKALADGEGFTIERVSESNEVEYFYSATSGDGIIVRTAVPYDMSLRKTLTGNHVFFWFMGILTLLLCCMALFQHGMAIHEENEKTRIKKQLTNNINHELKTPVASIQVCLETLIAHPEMDSDKRIEFIQRCYNNAERLRRLLVDVSTITRLDDGVQKIDREIVSLNDIIKEVIDEEKIRPEAKNFHFDISLQQAVKVNGNSPLLNSLFRNLIDNAMAYSCGNEIKIVLTVKKSVRECLIEVSDNGIGIAEEHLPHIFERFYRIDKGRSRRTGGTGLGLSIVKNTVLFHGGTICAENLLSGGLLFKITLPIVYSETMG